MAREWFPSSASSPLPSAFDLWVGSVGHLFSFRFCCVWFGIRFSESFGDAPGLRGTRGVLKLCLYRDIEDWRV